MQIGLNLSLTLEHGGAGAPTLDMTFTGTGNALDSRITFTRASTGTFFNSAGVLTSAAINAPRFDYNPATLAAQGLLIEEQRTNSIRNNTMQGAVAGTPGTLPTNWSIGGSGLGTLTQTIVGTGTSNGITYIDIRFNGTTSTTDFNIVQETATQIAALTGQSWSGSLWLAIVGGSTNNISFILTNIAERTSAGGFITQQSGPNLVSTLSSTLTRYSTTFTLNGGATVAYVQPRLVNITFAAGVAIDITLRIGLPQLEQGAFATSVIPTTTTALTRALDLSVVTTSPWFNATEGTFYAESLITYSTGTQFSAPFSVSASGASTNQIMAYYLSTNRVDLYVRAGGTIVADIGPTFTANTINKFAGAYKENDFAATNNGAAVSTDTSGALPSGINQLNLGAQAGGASGVLNGYLRRLTYYSRRLSNAELQAITV